MKLSVFALASFLIGAIPSPQSTTASLQGFVVRAGTTETIRGATVVLSSASNEPLLTLTADDGGNFRIANIPPGVYRLAATRDGYLRGEYGQRGMSRPGMPLTILPGQEVRNVAISLTPFGAISGYVYAKNGEPVRNATVQALNSMLVDGRRTLVLWQQARTNDRGEYRFGALQPAQYVISAAPPEAGIAQDVTRGPLRQERNGETYLPIYFPGTADVDASAPIDLLPGLESGGVSLTITEIDALRIRGQIVSGSTADPPSAIFIALSPRGRRMAVAGATAPRSIPVTSQGAFEVGGIAPGSYDLVARLGDGETRLSARVPIEIRNADVEDVVLTLQPAFRITGRVAIDGLPREDARKTAQVRVQLVHDPYIAQVAPDPAPVGPDGTFVMRGVIPGDYRVRVTTEFDSFIKVARFGGADILNSAVHIDGDTGNQFDILLGLNVGTIDAAVFDSKQEPAGGVQVVLAPDAPNRGRLDLYRPGFTDASGHIQIKNVDPGDYRLFAWEYLASGAGQDPDLVLRYEDLGTPVHVGEGAKVSANLRLIVARR